MFSLAEKMEKDIMAIAAKNQPKVLPRKPRGVNATKETKNKYMQERAAKIKKDREALLAQFSGIPQVKKVKCNVTNGFTIIGLNEVEIMDILNMFCDKMNLNAK
jgi:hypothetical protein